MVKRLLVILFVAAVLVGLIAYSQYRSEPAIGSGFIEADESRGGAGGGTGPRRGAGRGGWGA